MVSGGGGGGGRVLVHAPVSERPGECVAVTTISSTSESARPDFSRVPGFPGLGDSDRRLQTSAASETRGAEFTEGRLSVSATARFSPTFHALDTDPSVLSVFCPSPSQIEIGLSESDLGIVSALERLPPSSSSPSSSSLVVSGGREWGCFGGSSFLLRVLNHSLSPGRLLSLRTTRASLTDAITDASISLSLSPGEDPPHRATKRGDHLDGDVTPASVAAPPKSLLVDPVVGETFSAGDEILVSWVSPSTISALAPAGSVITTVSLWVDNTLTPDTLVDTVDVDGSAPSSGNAVFTVRGSWPSSTWYYAYGVVNSTSTVVFDGRSESRYFTCNPAPAVIKAAMVEPPSYAVFHPGERVPVRFVLSSAPAKAEVGSLSLWAHRYLLRDLLVARIERVNVSEGGLGLGFEVPRNSSVGLYESNGYYWELAFGTQVFYGEYFSVTAQEPNTAPDVHAIHVGTRDGVLAVALKAFGDVGQLQFALKVSSWGVDPTLLTAVRNVTQGSDNRTQLFFMREWNLTSRRPSTGYYVQMRFNCGKWTCSTAQTKTFALNWQPAITFQPPTPARGSNFTVDDPITLRWTSSASLASAAPVRVEVRVKYPSWVPYDPLLSNSLWAVLKNGDGEWKVYGTRVGSVFPLVFRISFNCLIGTSFWCEYEDSPEFSVPLSSPADSPLVSWNYDAVNARVKRHRIKLETLDCQSICRLYPKSRYCTSLCSNAAYQDLVPKATLDCVDCFFVLDKFSVGGASLEISRSKLKKLSLTSEGQFKFGAGAEISLGARLSYELKKRLVTWPIYGWAFYVGEHQFSIGLVFNLDEDTSLEAAAGLVLSAKGGGRVSYLVNLDYDEERSTAHDRNLVTKVSVEEFQRPQLDVSASVDFSMSSTFTSTISLTIPSLLDSSTSLATTLDVDATMRYPPYERLNRVKFDNTSLLSFGDCSAGSHLLRYNVHGANARSESHATIVPLGLSWSKKLELPSMSLLSGCLLQTAKLAAEYNGVVWVGFGGREVPLSDLGAAEESDFSEMLRMELNRAVTQFDDASGLLVVANLTEGRLRSFEVAVLPLVVTTDGVALATPRADRENLAQRLKTALEDPESGFFKGSMGSKLKGLVAQVRSDSMPSDVQPGSSSSVSDSSPSETPNVIVHSSSEAAPRGFASATVLFVSIVVLCAHHLLHM